MTPITIYQCDICELTHDTEAAALKCEAQGKPPAPNYKKGDEVFLYQKYDNLYARRTIDRVCESGHEMGYELNKLVTGANGNWIGCQSFIEDGCRLAKEGDFLKIGERVSEFNDIILTLEMIEK